MSYSYRENITLLLPPGESQGMLLQSHSDAFKVAHGRQVARLGQWKAITMVYCID